MENAIKINNLTYQYQNQTTLFQNFNLTIDPGQWVALVGHNGSGKSTLAKLIMGLLTPTQGEITVFNQVLSESTVNDVRSQIGMVFQNPDNQFVGATVADDVAFGLENNEIDTKLMPKMIAKTLEIVGMSEYQDREPHTLSGGQKQRVALASVLALQPKIIILDEATAMLDPEGRQAVMATLTQLKEQFGDALTLVTITHDMDEAALADRVVVINDGQLILDGTPAQVFSEADVLHHNGLGLPFSGEVVAHLNQKPKKYLNESELISWLSTSNK
ncbi:MAG: energy-coupling factor transporter ATPase [Leuconostoc fallax]